MLDLPLLVFGGQSGDVTLRDAFTAGFSIERNLACWAKVGAAPLTRNCLASEQVRHEVVMNGVGDAATVDTNADPHTAHLLALEQLNNLSCDLLNARGFDGDKTY